MATEPATYRPTSDRSLEPAEPDLDPLGELVATVGETIGFPTVPDVELDGKYYCERDGALEKIFDRRNGAEFDERIVLRSPSLTAGWHVYHQTTDGREHRVTDSQLNREHAFAIAESLAADLEAVKPACRTGRAR